MKNDPIWHENLKISVHLQFLEWKELEWSGEQSRMRSVSVPSDEVVKKNSNESKNEISEEFYISVLRETHE